MTSRRTAVYGVGGALLVAYFASANLPAPERAPRDRAPRPVATAGSASLAGDVRAQAARLRARMADAPVPAPGERNPFSFGAARRAVRAPTLHEAPVAVVTPDSAAMLPPPLPTLTLMGIAEETAAGATRRTAVISGDRDALYMVAEGQPVGDRYRVTRIGVDAVELEDLVTHGYRRIAMR